MDKSELPRAKSGSIICCVDGVCHLPNDKWHGTANGYSNHGCRCKPCRDAWAENQYNGQYMLKYRQSLLDLGLTLNGKRRKVPYKPRPDSGAKNRRPRRSLTADDGLANDGLEANGNSEGDE